MIDEVSILNIDLLSISCKNLLKKMNKGVLFTPNVDHIVKLQKDKDFYNAYREADWIVCDSKILQLVSRILGQKIKEVIPGSSFFPKYCDYHRNNKEVKLFLLGSAPGVAEIAMSNINQRIGRNIVVGVHSPSYGFENNQEECIELINIINKTEATVLIVGVGAPKQEKWIIKYKHMLDRINLFMGLGATIDFEANKIKRAPKIYQKFYLEWFYRILQEPKRMWKRYIIDDIPFFWLIIKQKIGVYKNPWH
jgi:exopolysaccharide biosynthesis WecB/TagA/CpsF family protein